MRKRIFDQDYMLGKLLDHYVNLNLQGSITEEEMERRMDRARLWNGEQIRRAFERIAHE